MKPQKAKERIIRIEAQKIETKQRNLKKAEEHAASQIIANAERQVRIEAQKIETKQRQIERDKIKAKEAQLAYERRKAERERVATEINKAAGNICHLIQHARSVEFDIEGNILWITRDNESHIIINLNKNWYNLELYSGNNWTIREDYYNTESIDDLCKTIEKCLQIGTLISKTEKESEEVIVDVETEIIKPVSEPEIMEPEVIIRSDYTFSQINRILQKAFDQSESILKELTPEIIKPKPEMIESQPTPEIIKHELETIESQPTPEIIEEIVERPVKITPKIRTKVRKPNRDRER